VRLIWYRRCAWYDIKDDAPDIISTVRLIWYRQCIWYQGQFIWYIKDSAPDITSRTVRLIWYRQCASYIDGAPDMISRTVRLIYRRCAWYDIKDSAPDLTSRTLRLIWYRQCIWYDIKGSVSDMILKTVHMIWHQGQCAWYDIDSASDMMSGTVCLIWYGRCAWYDIKDSAHDMTSRTLRLIWYRQCIWYDIKGSVSDMILRTVHMIWHQGQCAWYDIDSESDIRECVPDMTWTVCLIWYQGLLPIWHQVLPPFISPYQKEKAASVGTPPPFMPLLQFPYVHFYLYSIRVQPPGRLIWPSIDYSPCKDRSVPFLCHRNQRDSDSVDRVVIQGNTYQIERVSCLEPFAKRNRLCWHNPLKFSLYYKYHLV